MHASIVLSRVSSSPVDDGAGPISLARIQEEADQSPVRHHVIGGIELEAPLVTGPRLLCLRFFHVVVQRLSELVVRI